MRGQNPLPRNRRQKDTKHETAPGQLPVRASVPTHSPALPWLGVPMWNGGRPGFVTYIEEERQGTQRQDQPENPPRQRARPPRELTQPDQPASRATRNNRAAQPHPIQIGLPVTAPWKDKNGKNETPGLRPLLIPRNGSGRVCIDSTGTVWTPASPLCAFGRQPAYPTLPNVVHLKR